MYEAICVSPSQTYDASEKPTLTSVNCNSMITRSPTHHKCRFFPAVEPEPYLGPIFLYSTHLISMSVANVSFFQGKRFTRGPISWDLIANFKLGQEPFKQGKT